MLKILLRIPVDPMWASDTLPHQTMIIIIIKMMMMVVLRCIFNIIIPGDRERSNDWIDRQSVLPNYFAILVGRCGQMRKRFFLQPQIVSRRRVGYGLVAFFV